MNINNIVSIVTSIGVIIAIIQLLYLIRQYKKAHEEERRKETVKVVMEWSKSLLKDSNIAIKIINDFNQNQCKNLYEHQSFTIEKKTRNKYCYICSSQGSCNKENCDLKSENTYEMSGKHLAHLRYHVIRYLNLLESALISWKENIVDKELIEYEFIFLLDNNFEDFITYAKIESSYPVILNFCKTLKGKNEERAGNGRNPL